MRDAFHDGAPFHAPLHTQQFAPEEELFSSENRANHPFHTPAVGAKILYFHTCKNNLHADFLAFSSDAKPVLRVFVVPADKMLFSFRKISFPQHKPPVV